MDSLEQFLAEHAEMVPLFDEGRADDGVIRVVGLYSEVFVLSVEMWYLEFGRKAKEG